MASEFSKKVKEGVVGTLTNGKRPNGKPLRYEWRPGANGFVGQWDRTLTAGTRLELLGGFSSDSLEEGGEVRTLLYPASEVDS